MTCKQPLCLTSAQWLLLLASDLLVMRKFSPGPLISSITGKSCNCSFLLSDSLLAVNNIASYHQNSGSMIAQVGFDVSSSVFPRLITDMTGKVKINGISNLNNTSLNRFVYHIWLLSFNSRPHECGM